MMTLVEALNALLRLGEPGEADRAAALGALLREIGTHGLATVDDAALTLLKVL